MTGVERVRFRATSRLPKYWQLPSGAEGRVLCRYRLLNGKASRERLDIRFSQTFVLWGAPAGEFEPVEEATAV